MISRYDDDWDTCRDLRLISKDASEWRKFMTYFASEMPADCVWTVVGYQWAFYTFWLWAPFVYRSLFGETP